MKVNDIGTQQTAYIAHPCMKKLIASTVSKVARFLLHMPACVATLTPVAWVCPQPQFKVSVNHTIFILLSVAKPARQFGHAMQI